jgi:serine/threonine protein phosphatase 1
VAFLRQTVPYLATDDYIFVHAGLRPAVPLAEQTLDDLLWIRDPFLQSTYDWGRRVIHGHTPTDGLAPDILPHRINVDTGAVYGGALTAIALPDCTCIAIPAT